MSAFGRGDRTEGLNVPIMAQKQQTGHKWFVCCIGSTNDLDIQIPRPLASSLNNTAVDHARIAAKRL